MEIVYLYFLVFMLVPDMHRMGTDFLERKPIIFSRGNGRILRGLMPKESNNKYRITALHPCDLKLLSYLYLTPSGGSVSREDAGTLRLETLINLL